MDVINFGYIVPGSLLVEGYTTMSMLANGAVVQGLLSAKGVPEVEIKPVLQPFVNQVHLLGNPTMNYGVYLVNSFAPATLNVAAPVAPAKAVAGTMETTIAAAITIEINFFMVNYLL